MVSDNFLGVSIDGDQTFGKEKKFHQKFSNQNIKKNFIDTSSEESCKIIKEKGEIMIGSSSDKDDEI